MTEPSGLLRLNAANEAEAHSLLQRCCGAERWVAEMLSARPFSSTSELVQRAERAFDALERGDYLEAFSHHPEIGANLDELRRKFASSADLSQREQAGALGANAQVLHALRDKNRAYRDRFGYSFIVCATGKSAEQMLALLETRLEHAPDQELPIAAAEQKQIMRLRLEKLIA